VGYGVETTTKARQEGQCASAISAHPAAIQRSTAVEQWAFGKQFFPLLAVCFSYTSSADSFVFVATDTDLTSCCKYPVQKKEVGKTPPPVADMNPSDRQSDPVPRIRKRNLR
jgi:hypothetical protein